MSIVSLNARLNQLKSERKTLEKRLSSINKVVKKLGKSPVDDVGDIKKSAGATANALEDGVKGVPKIKNVVDDGRSKAKTGCSLDQWQEEEWLAKEQRRLESRIQELTREIARVEEEIRAARAAAAKAALAALAGGK